MISPLLANIYLHYVFDLWAKQWRQRHAHGDVIMVRYADDIVVGFEHQADAERFMAEMRERLAAFALTLHGEKTRLIRFGRFAALNRRERGEGKPETFNFLGFTHICGRSRRRWLPAETEDPARPDASAVAGDQGGVAATDAHDDRRAGRLAAAGGGWVLRLSCRPDQYRSPGGVPRTTSSDLWRRTLRRRSQKDTDDVGNGSTALAERWLPTAAYHSSLAQLNASPSNTQGGSRMREIRPYGSVRGARGNARPYRDSG